MQPEIITLGSDYSDYSTETVGDIQEWFKDTSKYLISPVTSTAKGVGHFALEFKRGVTTKDVGRIFKSPFKGAGHIAGSQFRDIYGMSEHYWRPSKMDWMKPIGALATAAGIVPTPLSPFLLAGGAALTTAGVVGTTIHQNKKAEDYAKEQSKILKEAKEDLKKSGAIKNQFLWAAIAGGGALLLYLK
jgi:hypothetical protein